MNLSFNLQKKKTEVGWINKALELSPSEKNGEECIFQHQVQIHAKDNLAKNDTYYYVEWRIAQSLDKANLFPRYYFYRLTDKSHYCMCV